MNDEKPKIKIRALLSLLLLGLLLRIVWLWLVMPVQFSDFHDYWKLAETIAKEGAYYEDLGARLRSFRPVGYPALLAGGIMMFGPEPWVPALLNILMFVGTSLFVFDLGRLMFGEKVAAFGVIMLIIDPGSIAATGLASTEPTGLFLYCGALWAAIRSAGTDHRWGTLVGVFLGLLVLVKPGFLLAPVVFLVFFRMVSPDLKIWTARSIPLVLAFIVILTPWAIRNYIIHDSILLVSSNGGDVFYRANNPLATGGWIEAGERDLHQYMNNEIVWNRMGYTWGLEWIRENPWNFVALILKKQILLFSDYPGTYFYYTLERGHEITTGISRLILYGIGMLWALGLWISIWRGIVLHWRQASVSPVIMMICLSVLYQVTIHSIFESQSRHLMPIVSHLILLACLAFTNMYKYAAAESNCQEDALTTAKNHRLRDCRDGWDSGTGSSG